MKLGRKPMAFTTASSFFFMLLSFLSSPIAYACSPSFSNYQNYTVVSNWLQSVWTYPDKTISFPNAQLRANGFAVPRSYSSPSFVTAYGPCRKFDDIWLCR